MLLERSDHRAWGDVRAAVSRTKEAGHRELPVQGSTSAPGGDPAEVALFVTGGSSKCNLPGVAPIITNNNDECTRPCTQLHEMRHVSDWGPCCARARAAYQAPGAIKASVMARWNAYLTTNEPWFECRGYGRSAECANAMNAILLCWAPAWAVRSLLIGAGALGGGAAGAAIGGAIGAGAGAGAGLAGGPAAPVTVPVGAAAGFVSGEVLGGLAGAGVGAMLGAAADTMRQACCRQVQSYRVHVTAQRTANCAAAGATPVCPF
jgi:hypothetical protein